MKCMVKHCTNRLDQGSFIGDMCSSCHHKLKNGDMHPRSTIWVVGLADAGLAEAPIIFDNPEDALERVESLLLDGFEPSEIVWIEGKRMRISAIKRVTIDNVEIEEFES